MGVPGSNKYRVQVAFNLENSAFSKGLRDINSQLDKTRKSIHENYQALDQELTRINRNILLTLGGIAAAFTAIAVPAVKMSGEFERLAVTFETLAGSVERAQKLIEDIKTFAATTPLQVGDIQQAATMMLGFGMSIDQVIPKLKILGEASAALRVPLEQIIRVRMFLESGQFRSTMLAPIGITRQALEAYGAEFGSAGQLLSTGEDAVEAFDTLLTERFGGLFDKVLMTITGRLSNIKDQVDLTFASIGDSVHSIAMEVFNWLVDELTRLREWIDENQEVVKRAWEEILSTIRPLTEGIANAWDRFMSALEKNPELLVDIARKIKDVINALVGLLILNSIILLAVKFAEAMFFVSGALGAVGGSLGGLTAFLVNPWTLAVLGVIAGLYLWYKNQKDVNEAIERATDEVTDNINALRDEAAEIKSVAGETLQLSRANDTSEESFNRVKQLVLELLDKYPEYAEKVGITSDETGQLFDANGDLITSIDDLSGRLNSFSTDAFCDELYDATTEAVSLRDAIADAIRMRDSWMGRASSAVSRAFGMEGTTQVLQRGAGGEYEARDINQRQLEEMERAGSFLESILGTAEDATEELEDQGVEQEQERERSGGGGVSAAERGGLDFSRLVEGIATVGDAFKALTSGDYSGLTDIGEEIVEAFRLPWEKYIALLMSQRKDKPELGWWLLSKEERYGKKPGAMGPEERQDWEGRKKQAGRDYLDEINEPVNEIFRSLRESIVSSAEMLGASILTGDIAGALQKVFSSLGNQIGNYVNRMIAPKGSSMGLQLLGGLAGGLVGAGIGLLGGLFSKKKSNDGSSVTTPIYAHVTNFPEDRLGGYLPFSFLFSGRSGLYDVDYRGASLDRMRSSRRLGMHYGQ